MRAPRAIRGPVRGGPGPAGGGRRARTPSGPLPRRRGGRGPAALAAPPGYSLDGRSRVATRADPPRTYTPGPRPPERRPPQARAAGPCPPQARRSRRRGPAQPLRRRRSRRSGRERPPSTGPALRRGAHGADLVPAALPRLLMIGLPVVFALLAAPGVMLWATGAERDITLDVPERLQRDGQLSAHGAALLHAGGRGHEPRRHHPGASSSSPRRSWATCAAGSRM